MLSHLCVWYSKCKSWRQTLICFFCLHQFSSQKISEAPDLSLDKDMICEPLKPSTDLKEKSPLPKTNVLEMELETHPNETEMEKSVCSSDSLNFTLWMFAFNFYALNTIHIIEITLESNFRVNLIWVGWVNFNSGRGFFIWIELIFFGLSCF